MHTRVPQKLFSTPGGIFTHPFPLSGDIDMAISSDKGDKSWRKWRVEKVDTNNEIEVLCSK